MCGRTHCGLECLINTQQYAYGFHRCFFISWYCALQDYMRDFDYLLIYSMARTYTLDYAPVTLLII